MGWRRLLFSFHGRINRAQFWWGLVVAIVDICFLALVASGIIGLLASLRLGANVAGTYIQASAAATVLSMTLIVLLLVWFLAAISVKRLHDRNRSGWWAVLVFAVACAAGSVALQSQHDTQNLNFGLVLQLLAALLGIWLLIEVGFLRGTKGPNRFGPDPLDVVERPSAGLEVSPSSDVGSGKDYRQIIGRLFGFRGRIGRGAFLLFALPYLLVLAALRFSLSAATSPQQPTGFGFLIYEAIGNAVAELNDGHLPLVATILFTFTLLLFVSACVRQSFDMRWDEGVLVHELVHHLQNTHRRRFRCREERERDAYLIQRRYVEETRIGAMPSWSFILSLRCTYK